MQRGAEKTTKLSIDLEQVSGLIHETAMGAVGSRAHVHKVVVHALETHLMDAQLDPTNNLEPITWCRYAVDND